MLVDKIAVIEKIIQIIFLYLFGVKKGKINNKSIILSAFFGYFLRKNNQNMGIPQIIGKSRRIIFLSSILI